jgi:glycosyltransferase involved in cell wall biosynthesis
MSAMALDILNSYKNWIDFDLYDSYIFIAADDYYFYKKLGFKNEIYIPNLNTFVPSETKSSNLTYNNIIMLGRQNDPIKGAKYAVKSMFYIIKEVPDAKLTLVTSDSRVQFLRDLIKELNLTNNVFIHGHTYNISSYFWNSSVHMYTSFSEAYPMAMNEGKAHGMPIVAFDVPYSPPYQKGVIVVDQLDCEALARETIKLLKDYDYRKKMGEKAKESLSEYSNDEIAEIWGKLFRALLSNDTNEYRQLQNEIENKYYNEDEARIRMHRSYELLKRVNKNLTCHYVENFTDINYVKNIKLCNISNNDSFRNLL